MTDPRFLGVDAGGSKTVALVGDGERVLGRGVAGSANPRLVGSHAALTALGEAAAMALGQAGSTAAEVLVTWIGGAGSWPAAELRAQAAGAIGVSTVEVSHDGRLLLAAAGLDEGIAVVAGTGSSAYGRDASGAEVTLGGWGHLLGDEGSGYDIARSAMRAATRAIDGRGPATALVDALLRDAGAPGPGDLRDRMYPAPSVDRTARFARAVLGCASEGDAVARAIVDEAGAELAALVLAAGPSLHLEAPARVVGGGGLLAAGSPLLDAVEAHLAGRIEHTVTTNDDEPAAGALALARRLGNEV